GGSIRFDGQEITGLPTAEMRAQRRRMQIVFQDPYASLDPRQRVRDVVASFGVTAAISVASSGPAAWMVARGLRGGL
ncbi:hypothetical protein SB780_42050, partial [Burkholderia sp. SIMBA_057]